MSFIYYVINTLLGSEQQMSLDCAYALYGLRHSCVHGINRLYLGTPRISPHHDCSYCCQNESMQLQTSELSCNVLPPIISTELRI